MTAKSRSSRQRSASSPDDARTRRWPSGSRIASSARRFSGRSSTSRMSTGLVRGVGVIGAPPRADGAGATPSVDAISRIVSTRALGHAADRGRRHRRTLGRRRRLHERQPAAVGDALQSARAVGVRAGEHHAHRALGVRVGRRLEASRRSTDGCSAPALGREREEAAVDEQMVVGRRDVHAAPRRSAPCPRLHTRSTPCDPGATRRADGPTPCGDAARRPSAAEIAPAARRPAREREQAPPRRSDDDDLVGHPYLTFRYSFSRASSFS